MVADLLQKVLSIDGVERIRKVKLEKHLFRAVATPFNGLGEDMVGELASESDWEQEEEESTSKTSVTPSPEFLLSICASPANVEGIGVSGQLEQEQSAPTVLIACKSHPWKLVNKTS